MTGLEEAQANLQQQQAKAATQLGSLGAAGPAGAVLARALAKADQRERESTEKGDAIYSDVGFHYPATLEKQRLALTRDIIRRTSPGAAEDGVYLEMIARQAASIEIVLRGIGADQPNAKAVDVCDRLLLGTMPVLDPSAYARRFGDFYYVFVAAGLIDFVFQLAKATVLSWKPSPQATGYNSFLCEPEDIEAVIAADPRPITLLRETLAGYLFDAQPRSTLLDSAPRVYHQPLQVLTNFNERFIIAHEYGHTLHDALDIVYPDAPAWTEEFASDAIAFRLVIESGHALDRMPPNIATYGAFFVLTALEIIRKTLDIVRHGAVQEDHGFVSHPPIAQRLSTMQAIYGQSVPEKEDQNSIRGALIPARTLELLWTRMMEAPGPWQSGRKLHPIWDST